MSIRFSKTNISSRIFWASSGIVFADVVDDRGFHLLADEVEDFGGVADAAHRGLLGVGGGTGQDARQGLVQFEQRCRLHTIEGGNAQQHIVAQTLGEVLEDLAGLVEFEVHQDGGYDLRMLVANQVGHGGGIHPLQALDAGRVVARHDAADEAGGAVVAQRLGQHGLDGFVVDRHGGALGGLLGEFVNHFFDALARHLFQRRHGVAELLHFLRPEILQNLGSLVLPQR
jgi:hypothetical protein